VFALSGWDLVGALPLDRRQVSDLIKTGDTRWVHRPAYDLMDYQPNAGASASQMPRGVSLYGSLPQQLRSAESFVSGLRDMLALRKKSGLATAKQLDVPEVSHKSMLVMVHRLDTAEQVTVLNFSPEPIEGSVISTALVPGSAISDMSTGENIGTVDDLHGFSITLGPHEGRSLLSACPGDHEDH
jgi:hypothetical protein